LSKPKDGLSANSFSTKVSGSLSHRIGFVTEEKLDIALRDYGALVRSVAGVISAVPLGLSAAIPLATEQNLVGTFMGVPIVTALWFLVLASFVVLCISLVFVATSMKRGRKTVIIHRLMNEKPE
jgi:hypothetical protein